MQNRQRAHHRGAWWTGARPDTFYNPTIYPQYGGYNRAATPAQRHPQMYHNGPNGYPMDNTFIPYPEDIDRGRGTTYSRSPQTPNLNQVDEAEAGGPTQGEEETENVELHPILHCHGPTYLFDVRKPPEWSLQRTFQRYCLEPAVHGIECQSIRLVSRDFPWSITITPFSSVRVRFVTCGDILYGLHRFLDQRMDSLDWRLVLFQDEDTRDALQAMMDKRVKDNPTYQAKKGDWLQSKFFFRGLVKDDDFANTLLPPGRALHPHTYVVKMVE